LAAARQLTGRATEGAVTAAAAEAREEGARPEDIARSAAFGAIAGVARGRMPGGGRLGARVLSVAEQVGTPFAHAGEHSQRGS
jgi:hypothetical protein